MTVHTPHAVSNLAFLTNSACPTWAKYNILRSRPGTDAVCSGNGAGVSDAPNRQATDSTYQAAR
jgi:hypothetical protein